MLRALQRRRLFRDLCRENALALDWAPHRDSVAVLADVWRDRAYALGFPFGERARVLDLGAHKGYFSLFAARHAGPGSTIHAYEPAPTNVAILRDALAANGASEAVTVHEAAIGARTGRGRVEGGPSFNRRVRPDPAGGVPVVSLADALAALGGAADFAKMDCEGAEYDVLGSPDDTVRRVATWALEFHDTGDPARTGLTLRSRLLGLGYAVLRFSYSPSRADLNYGLLVATRRP